MSSDRIFASLGDPVRLELCELMVKHQGKLTVNQLTAEVNRRLSRTIQQPSITYHLRNLEDAGLVTAQRARGATYYAFASEVFEEAVHATRIALVFLSSQKGRK